MSSYKRRELPAPKVPGVCPLVSSVGFTICFHCNPCSVHEDVSVLSHFDLCLEVNISLNKTGRIYKILLG